VTGPTSFLKDVTTYVSVDASINSTSREQLATKVLFKLAGSPVDVTKLNTIPPISWQPQTVTVLVQALQGTETIQVAVVDASPSSPPPAGYHVTGIVINPQLITITGAPDVVGSIQSITLAPVSLAGYTSNHTFSVKIVSPDPSLRLSATVAQITYLIAAIPAITASP
jgi:YbbR domain-containing protein